MAGDRHPRQFDRRIEIHTALDSLENSNNKFDPLLLIYVKGTEEVSQPYSYNVKMWRLVDNKTRFPIPPGDMINTPAEIRINLKQKLEVGEASRTQDHFSDDDISTIDTFVQRFGVFETFTDEGLVLGESPIEVKLQPNEDARPFRVRQYSATIVPAFKMLAYENTYRVFEDLNAINIIHRLTDGYPHLKIDDEKCNNTFFPKIPYCVQYQESTFNFLSRLMARFGIWYYFDHNRDAKNNISTMILGAGPARFDKCRPSGRDFLPDHPIHELGEITNKDLDENVLTIKNFQRIYNPMTRRARYGNFNILVPTDPITAADNIQAQRDLIQPVQTQVPTKDRRTDPDDDDRFRTEGFAAPVDQNAEPTSTAGPSGPSAHAYAQAWLRGKETVIAKVSGATRNPALVPGFSFDRMVVAFRSARDDLEDVIGEEDRAASKAGADSVVFQNKALKPPPKQKLGSYVVFHSEFEAFETSYSEDSKNFGKILSELIFPSNVSSFDILANGTAQGVNNYLQNQLPLNFGQPPGGPLPNFGAFTLGGGLSALTAVIPLFVQAIEKLDNEKTGDFHCSFVAIPFDGIDYSGDGRPKTAAPLLSLPLPSMWVQPSAAGPHLAVVIGREGINDDTERGQVYADVLGRVRVRFAWDRAKGEKPGDAFKRGSPACWVRVSEAWAGRGFGTQFLPRIGQEVIVDFIDGDPDRPIITGRVYNADRRNTNIPFPHGEQQQQPVELKDVLTPTGFHDFRFNGIKTRSMPLTQGDKDRFHLLRFDDTKDKEQYLIRSQRRLDITALEKRYESISSDRHLTVGGKDEKTQTIGGNYIAKVFKDYHLHVGDPAFPFQSGNRNTKLEAAESLSVGQNSDESIGGNWSVSVGGGPTVGGQVSISALLGTGVISLSAMTNITLMCGASILVMTPAGVSITAPVINLVGPVLGPTPVMGPSPVPLPPMPAIPAVPQSPQDPTPADPGDKLTPPKE